MKKLGVFVFIAAFLLPAITSIFFIPSNAATDSKVSLPLKVGFLLVGPIGDNGFNSAHNKGRLYLESVMHGKVQTNIAERVPENAEVERVLEKMIAQGDRLIFTPSYGFLEPMSRVAKRHPDVIFMQINRLQTANNIGAYYSHQYQPQYIAGIVAGRMTKTNKLGCVAGHPVPPGLQQINSFIIGARSVNPKATVRVIWINSWSDPSLEAEAVKSLAENGIDVVTNFQDNQNTILKSAEDQKIYAIGCWSDGHALAPHSWLTGSCIEWGPLYAKIAQQVIDGTWKPHIYADGMEGGYIRVSSFGPAVPASVRKEALAAEDKIMHGQLSIFEGPLKDRDGIERLKPGEKANLKWLTEMNFLVPGVEGALPK